MSQTQELNSACQFVAHYSGWVLHHRTIAPFVPALTATSCSRRPFAPSHSLPFDNWPTSCASLCIAKGVRGASSWIRNVNDALQIHFLPPDMLLTSGFKRDLFPAQFYSQIHLLLQLDSLFQSHARHKDLQSMIACRDKDLIVLDERGTSVNIQMLDY